MDENKLKKWLGKGPSHPSSHSLRSLGSLSSFGSHKSSTTSTFSGGTPSPSTEPSSSPSTFRSRANSLPAMLQRQYSGRKKRLQQEQETASCGGYFPLQEPITRIHSNGSNNSNHGLNGNYTSGTNYSNTSHHGNGVANSTANSLATTSTSNPTILHEISPGQFQEFDPSLGIPEPTHYNDDVMIPPLPPTADVASRPSVSVSPELAQQAQFGISDDPPNSSHYSPQTQGDATAIPGPDDNIDKLATSILHVVSNEKEIEWVM